MTLMRLQRALARAGVASRRAAEDLIREEKVRVNGEVAHLGMSVETDRDVIMVQGRRITHAKTVWIALHKPLGYVVTRHDPEGRETVFRLVPDVPGLTYVGRLDVMTSGLLLLTTDGGAAHRLMHPRFEVERSYRVVVHGRSQQEIENAFAKGIVIEGRKVNLLTLKIRPADEGRRGSLELLLVLAEGRYRIVRRICEKLDLKVERLIRLSYGPIRLGPMEPGTWRYLSKAEIAMIGGGPTVGRSGGPQLRQDIERDGGKRTTPARSSKRQVGPTGSTRTARPADRRDKRKFGKPGAKRPAGPPSRRPARRPTRRRGDW